MNASSASRRRRAPQWLFTHAGLRAVILAVLTAVLALMAGRPDLLVAAAPLAIIAVWTIAERPRGQVRLRFRTARDVVTEGQSNAVIVTAEGTEDAEILATSVAPTPYIERRPRHGARAVDLSTADPGEAVEVSTGIDPQRWGLHPVGPVRAAAAGSWGAYMWGPETFAERTRRVLPAPEVFDTSAPAPHPRGLVGQHRSTRPGDGSEFNTIRPFQWGDKLKRINWTHSARTGELHVTSSYADQDTHLALLVDAQLDLTPAGGEGPTTLDTSVRAAAAISEHFTRQGDRVSLQVVSGHMPQRLPAGTGRRHARRVLDVLSKATPSAEHRVDFDRIRLGLPPGTLVVMVSPLISPAILTRAASLARSGLTVVAIDVLGESFNPTSKGESLDELAWRIRQLERALEIRRVQQAGVAVVPWRGPGSMDMVLQLLARRGTGAMR